MRRTESFRLQHAELARHADLLEERVRLHEEACAAPAADRARLAAELADETRSLLGAFAAALAEHTELEDDRLYPLLYRHVDERVRTTARALREGFGVIYAGLEVFLAVWMRPGALEEDPRHFTDQTRPLLSALRQRITRENDELYALVDDLGS